MARENKTMSLTVNSGSRIRYMSDREDVINKGIEDLNKMGGKLINIVEGPIQTLPLGVIFQTINILYEVETEDPKYQEYVKSQAVKKAGQSQTQGGCYIATSVYGSYDCPEVWTLRRYRDDTLAETLFGRAFIQVYYAISPTLVKWFGKTEWFKRICRQKLDAMVKKLNDCGITDSPYQDRIW